jgi:hypothetical protein
MTTHRPFAAALLSLAALVPGGVASAQSPEQRVTVTVQSGKTVEEQVADEYKARKLRKEAEEALAAEEAARIAAKSPRALLERAKTFYVASSTSFFEPVQLDVALRERTEFAGWNYVIVDGYDQRDVADVVVTIDRPLFTYTFTYLMIARGTGIVLASGKITAFDGNAAAPRLAKKIVEEIRDARGETKKKKD